MKPTVRPYWIQSPACWCNISTGKLATINTSLHALAQDDVMIWKGFPHYWPFVRGILSSLVDFRHKGPAQSFNVFAIVMPHTLLKNKKVSWNVPDLRRHMALLWCHCYVSAEYLSHRELCLTPPGTPYICQWTGSAMVEVMVCHLFGEPSHYLNQCWLIVNWTLGNKFQWNLKLNSIIFIQENAFENAVCQNGGHFVQEELS